jgi:hypothetical protein
VSVVAEYRTFERKSVKALAKVRAAITALKGQLFEEIFTVLLSF